MVPDTEPMDTIQSIDALNKQAWDCTLASPSRGRELAVLASAQAKASAYIQGQAAASLNLAWCEYYLSHLDAAEQAATDALSLNHSLNDLAGLSMVFLILGAVAQERGEFNKALDCDLKAVELAQAAGRKDREASALNNVGEVLMNSGELHEALNYFMQASSAMKDAQQAQAGVPVAVELESNLFANLGQAFIEIGETENAQGYLELARSAAEASGDANSEVRSLKGLAVAARRQNRRELAYDLLKKALSRAEEAGQAVAALEINTEKALLLLDEGRKEEALGILDEAVRTCESRGLVSKLADCLKRRSLAYESAGRFAEALADYKRSQEVADSLSADRLARSVKDAEIRFDLARAQQEAEIYRLRNVELKDHRAELERTNNRLKAVAEIGRVATASLDLETVARTVHESLGRLMDASGFALVVHDEIRRELRFSLFIEDGVSFPAFSVPSDSQDSFAAWVIRENEALRINNAEKEYAAYIRSDSLTFGRRSLSSIYAPLSMGGRVVGAVGVQSAKVSAYTEDDAQTLDSLGSFIAVAIENSRTHTELLRLHSELKEEKDALEALAHKVSNIANHDGLTGLPNRLLLGELLDKALHRAKRLHSSLAVLFMDLDDFKPINDRFGHHAGDLALIEVSKRLKDALRESDVVARVGGDEFVAFVSDLESPGAAGVVAEKIIALLQPPILVQGTPSRVGVSIGLSLYPQDGGSADDLLRHADDAMYRIKKSGKNGYSFFAAVLPR